MKGFKTPYRESYILTGIISSIFTDMEPNDKSIDKAVETTKAVETIEISGDEMIEEVESYISSVFFSGCFVPVKRNKGKRKNGRQEKKR